MASTRGNMFIILWD